jgi:hypothetical protein
VLSSTASLSPGMYTLSLHAPGKESNAAFRPVATHTSPIGPIGHARACSDLRTKPECLASSGLHYLPHLTPDAFTMRQTLEPWYGCVVHQCLIPDLPPTPLEQQLMWCQRSRRPRPQGRNP